MRIILSLALMLLLAACNNFENGNFNRDMPWKPNTMPPLPKGSPEFTKGWEDGCVSGMGAYGSDVYKSLYKWKRDEQLAQTNITYYKAWKDSYNYCRHFLQTWSKPVDASEGLLPVENTLSDPIGFPDGSASDYPSIDNFLQQKEPDGMFITGVDNFFSAPNIGN